MLLEYIPQRDHLITTLSLSELRVIVLRARSIFSRETIMLRYELFLKNPKQLTLSGPSLPELK